MISGPCVELLLGVCLPSVQTVSVTFGVLLQPYIVFAMKRLSSELACVALFFVQNPVTLRLVVQRVQGPLVVGIIPSRICKSIHQHSPVVFPL